MLYSLRLVGEVGMKEWIVESLFSDHKDLAGRTYPWVCSRDRQLEWPMTLEDCIEAIRHEFTRPDLGVDAIERVTIRNVNTGETIPGAILGV